jgi:hypothetical protein
MRGSPKRSAVLGLVLWLLVASIAIAASIGVNRLMVGPVWDRNLFLALAILGFNLLMFLAAMLFRRHPPAVAPLVLGLLWISLKLFVNTFTIFLFIGLQAVDPPVFVPVLFAGYIPALFGGVFLLHIMSLDQGSTLE